MGNSAGKCIFTYKACMEVCTYFNFSVKALKIFTDILNLIISCGKIPLLMQCVESITDVLFSNISLINAAMPLI
jgi:hypothetical protein